MLLKQNMILTFIFLLKNYIFFFQLFLYSFETLPKCVKNIKLVVVESKYL